MSIDIDQLRAIMDKIIIRVEHPEEDDCYADVKAEKIEKQGEDIIIYITSPV